MKDVIALHELALLFEKMGKLHPSRDLREVLPDPAGLAVRIRLALAAGMGEDTRIGLDLGEGTSLAASLAGGLPWPGKRRRRR